MIIYKTTNLVNGKIYVGKDSLNDPKYLGSGFILRRAIKKYGVENFRKDILEQCQSLREMESREQYWIKQLDSTNRLRGYNITNGGTGGNTFANQLASKKKKIREKLSLTSIELWKNPQHRDHMVKVMSGRDITWSDKISKSIAEWHKTNPIPKASIDRANEIRRQKMTGYEFKSFSPEVKDKIILLYQSIGPKRIARQLREEGIDASPYLVTNVLKKAGVYQQWQKGIGKHSS